MAGKGHRLVGGNSHCVKLIVQVARASDDYSLVMIISALCSRERVQTTCIAGSIYGRVSLTIESTPSVAALLSHQERIRTGGERKSV